jgi:arylsulfatase A-like enzyme
MLTGQGGDWPRKGFFYWNDDGELVAFRYDRWKVVFKEQQSRQFRVWMDPFVNLRVPLIFDLRMDPFERASTDSNSYYEWMERMAQIIGVAAQSYTGKMIMTFKEFPPRQKPASFNLDQVMESLTSANQGK